MSARRSIGTHRSLAFLNVLLLSTAFALPAAAQIEEVVVTAQKKTEDVQSVPIAVTAFTGDDLKTNQINQVKDLQFHAPNVTYTAGQFGVADFQIRGIGVTAVGYDNESGVAVDFDEVYLSAPQLTEGAFFDLAGVEVLAGPQSTLYGRGATGGVVNINIAKPDLGTPMAELIGTYGNYNAYTVQGVVNLPIITDQLGLRISGEWDKRDGFVTNIFNGGKVDSLDQYAVRGTLRWQPSERTTIDVTGQFWKEDDSHMRSNKQLCTSDPTGVLGCLPGSAGTGPVNGYSNLSVIGSSQQGMENAFAGSPLAGLAPFLGLYNLAAPNTVPPGYVDPTGARQINTDFTPIWRSQDNFLSLKWQQNVVNWLDSTLILGYDRDSYFSQESYNNIPGQPLPRNTDTSYTGVPIHPWSPIIQANCLASYFGSPNLDCAEYTFMTVLTLFGPPGYAANYAPFLLTHPGELPISGVGNLGIIGGNYTFTPNNEAFDQSNGESSEYSAEWRLATSFGGPLNGMMGLYYLHSHVTGDYYVNASSIDYPAIIFGGLSGLADPACYSAGCILASPYYHNVGQYADLTSKAIFGEIYYQAIPDTLKFTAGLRYTDDLKTQSDRILIWNGGLLPIGTTSESAIPAIPNLWDNTRQDFRKITGRVVADWTPKLDFTDQTLIYASYARGYKAGGANPGIQADNNLFGLPLTYAPEFIDAYEVGTKNQLLGATLQANGDVYYYNYTGLQVSVIQSNTSINENINAHVWGAEGNFLWQPTDRWQFGLNLAHEESTIVNTSLVDMRNPTGGDPNTLLIKDDTVSGLTGGNCVVYFTGAFPGLPAGLGFTPPAGGIGALASSGIAHAAFGACPSNNPNATPEAQLSYAALHALGYTFTGPNGGTTEGEPVSLNNDALQNAPNLAIGLSGQYTQPLPGDYSLIARVDFHWQSHFWTRIWQDGADFVGSQTVTNASLQLNSPDGVWYARGFIKNIFNANNITGAYLASPTSGLYTNAFYGDPRTYGITLGVRLD